ncbi:MAG: hypothetical protein JNK72_06580 [Myxococcales bacterium]|nr:hypothetical protein [Myxococcales bacterium]
MRPWLRGPLAALVVTRALLFAAAWVSPRWDGFFYLRFAARLAAGLGYVDLARSAVPTAFYPVGFVAAWSWALRLVGTPRGSLFLLHLAASAAGCAAVMVGTRRLRDEATARRAGWCFVLHPGFALWSLAAMSETLTASLLAVAFAAHATRRWWLLGLSVGLATLVRPPSVWVLAVALCAAGPLRARLKRLACAGLVAAAVLAPWAARNCVTLDRCAMVSTNAGINLYIGALDEAHGGYILPAPRVECERAAGEVARDRCYLAAARDRIAARPWAWALRGAEKLAVTFGVEHDPVAYLRAPRPLSRDPWGLALTALCTLGWWATLGATLASLWRQRTHDAARAAALVLGLTALTHAVFLGADRYHLVLLGWCAPWAVQRRP